MSYTTRCPACGTTFRVVPDQLKISDGWVRCGHCADVFDATLYLQAWVPPPAAAARAPDPVVEASVNSRAEVAGPAAMPPDNPSTPPAPTGWRDARDFDTAQGATVPAALESTDDHAATALVAHPGDTGAQAGGAVIHGARAAEASPWPVNQPVVEADDAGEWLAEIDAAPPRDAATVAEQNVPLEVPDPAVQVSPRSDGRVPAPDDAADFQAELARFAQAAGRTVPDVAATASESAEAAGAPAVVAPPIEVAPDVADVASGPDEPGFVRQARRRAFWHSPGVRAVLSLLVVGLAGLLAAQWALHERDQLAARQPQLLPLLTQLCAPLGCEVGPVRRIDAVVIDSSTLARRLGNFYAFDVVLKNTADTAVATPALELSLTDTQDQVIVRRVFLPAELPGTPSQLPAQGTVPVSLRLAISETGPLTMAGYRALLFYP